MYESPSAPAGWPTSRRCHRSPFLRSVPVATASKTSGASCARGSRHMLEGYTAHRLGAHNQTTSRPYEHRAPSPRDEEGEVLDIRMLGPGERSELEVGPGRRLDSCSSAPHRTGQLLVGLEIRRKWATVGDERLAKLRSSRARPRVLRGRPARATAPRPSGLGGACVPHFPDPWWKKRHPQAPRHGRCLPQRVVRLLRDGGELFVQTDVEERADLYANAIAPTALSRGCPGGQSVRRPVALVSTARSPMASRLPNAVFVGAIVSNFGRTSVDRVAWNHDDRATQLLEGSTSPRCRHCERRRTRSSATDAGLLASVFGGNTSEALDPKTRTPSGSHSFVARVVRSYRWGGACYPSRSVAQPGIDASVIRHGARSMQDVRSSCSRSTTRSCRAGRPARLEVRPHPGQDTSTSPELRAAEEGSLPCA